MPANPTPSLAGTAETMTAEDARLLGDGVVLVGGYKRIAATYAAFAERTAEIRNMWVSIGKRDGDILRLQDEVDDLRASLATAQEALEPFAHFWRQWERQPMRGLDDEFYCIHTGSEYEASLRRSDCQRAAELLDAARPHATPEGTP